MYLTVNVSFQVMGRHCCVLGCSSGVHLPFHSFPKNEIMANRWKRAIQSEKIQHLTDEQLRKCVVCYRHFADSDYESIYKLRRLKPGVVPSLFLPENSNNNEKLEAKPIVENFKTEASYTPTIADFDKGIETTRNAQFVSEVSNVTSTLKNEDSSQTRLSSSKNSTDSYDKHTKYFHNFTPKMWKLYRIACILKRKQEAVSRKQLSFRQRIRQAKQYSKSPAIKELLCSLTPTQRTFVQMQINGSKCSPKVCA